MSLPPQIVRVKRKASEAPVDFLRVHEASGKRQRRATDFVFSRQQFPETANASLTSAPAPHGDRRIKAIHRSSSSQISVGKIGQPIAERGSTSEETENPTTSIEDSTVPATTNLQHAVQGSSAALQNITQPRRFHISRSATSSTSKPSPLGSLRRKRGARDDPVFVERRVRPRTSDGPADQVDPTPFPLAIPPTEQSTQVRTQKKPGLAKRNTVVKNGPSAQPSQSSPAPPPVRQLQIPSGYANSDEFLAQMQAYTLQEIGHSIAESQAFGAQISTPITTPRKPKSKFTPKKPVLRYHERHPEQAAMLNAAHAADTGQAYEDQEDTDDDSEYIIDTYVRIPAGVMEKEDNPKDFGLLVLDSQPDIDEFYREHDDSDDEEEDEEEDENAENHYSADYPDEEVDSDDEYGRNAYNYRNHNASDLEEYDEDDATFSDEDNDDTKYPWLRKPWLVKHAIGDEVGEDDEERV